MHPHLLILAILSLRVLAGFIITPHDHKDSHCAKKAIGKPIEVWDSHCAAFQSAQLDAFIQIKSHRNSSEHDYYLVAYIDTNCQYPNAFVTPDEINVKNSTCHSTVSEGPLDVVWGSFTMNKTINLTADYWGL